MLFKEFLKCLVVDVFSAHETSLLLGEEFRKSFYHQSDDKAMKHKTTRREINGIVREVPEKTQHHLHDLPVRRAKLKTDVDIYEKDGELHTHVKSKLFEKVSNVEIEIEFSIEEPPEGTHALTDEMNDNLKSLENRNGK